jgi:hypothetical protein
MSRIMLIVCAALLVSFATLAFAADAPAGQGKTGVIASVDAKASTFVLTLPARPLTFTVDSKTAITLDGKASTFEAAIKPELTATVTYSKVGEDRLASKVEVKSAAEKK